MRSLDSSVTYGFLEMAFVSLKSIHVRSTLCSNVMKGRVVASSELVPGDVYEVSDPSLTQLPCDSLLLAGDCIINESMLTGMTRIVQLPLPYQLMERRRICAGFQDTSDRRRS